MSSKDESPKLTVPKFSSFKAKEATAQANVPKFSSFRSNESEKRKISDEDRDPDSRSKRSRHAEGRRSETERQPRSHRHGSRHRHRDHSKPSARSKTPVQLEPPAKATRPDNTASRLYVIDPKGDPLVLRYGGSDKSKIPAYWRYGSGRVLGTSGRLIIHREGPRDVFSLRMPGEGSSAFKDKDGLRSKNFRITPNPRRIRTKAPEGQPDEVEDFLPLSTSKKRKHSHNNSESGGEDEQPNYRSIEGKAKPRRFSDSDSDSETESLLEAVDLEHDNPLKWKSIQLSRQVKDHPDDIDAWLEIARHQDTLLRAGEDIDHKALDGEVHSYAEIKVSMLESALKNVSHPRDRLRVLVPLMREGIKVWNSKTTAKKWAGLLKDEEISFVLWKTHLDFAMSDIATFHYDDIKKMHLDRFHQTIQRSQPDSLKENFGEAIYIFLRVTRFIHDSGYKELAVAAWQAVLELNLFRPSHIDDHERPLSEFSDFWESEVPRIGEPEAQGWAKFVESGGLGDPPLPLQEDGDHYGQSRDDYKVWASLEHDRAEKARMPARTMDEGTEDDPFRVVMFSDIEQLLLVIPHSVLPELVPQLLDAFLIFLRLPPAFRLDDGPEAAHHDQFLAGPSPEGELLIREKSSEFDPLSEEIQRMPPRFGQLGSSTVGSLDELFPGRDWFSYIPPTTQNRQIQLELATNATRQLVHTAKIEPLAQYYLALCAVKDGTRVKKPAKALLKQYPSNLSLYGAYGLAEFSNNNHEIATKVLSSATELASNSSNSNAFSLWRIWSWMELERGNKELAIRRLCSSVDKALRSRTEVMDVSHTHLLKAQQAFSSNIMHSLSTGNIDDAATYVECLGLLSYLTAEGCTEPTSGTQGNISSAMGVFRLQSVEFKARGLAKSRAHERTLQFAAKILYLNATRGPYRRAYMLEQLRRFMLYFPRNTIFLALFEWADASLRVIDEVRTLLHESVLVAGQDGVSSRLFAIQHEMQRGNVNTAKAAFEDAVRSDTCKFSVPVWTLFIKFCGSHKEIRSKAKDVLFRAMRHCPWSKAVMMEAFLTVNRDLESTELRGVFDTMTSKGLRVHVDLDEFLEMRRRERRGNKEEGKM
ncbi:NRDE-2, necessary for RNA interference-domain-containing protein, partial [Thelonectria olida]